MDYQSRTIFGKRKRHLLEVGQFGLLNLAHVPQQDFAHGIKGILPLKKFIEIHKICMFSNSYSYLRHPSFSINK
jgi:hypothetical protein